MKQNEISTEVKTQEKGGLIPMIKNLKTIRQKINEAVLNDLKANPNDWSNEELEDFKILLIYLEQ